jgi:uncharacterized membrane protein
LLLSREQAAQLAYVGGSLGTIGGAGTFDGIFLIGIVAVLIASLSQSWSRS